MYDKNSVVFICEDCKKTTTIKVSDKPAVCKECGSSNLWFVPKYINKED